MKSKFQAFRPIVILLFFVTISCQENKVEVSEEYFNELKDWNNKRIENLKKTSGWLNLVGLFWLEEGVNTFGSSEENDIVFPKNAPKKLGQLVKTDSTIIFISDSEAEVVSKNEIVTELIMKTDLSGNPTILENGSLRWFLIARGEKYGIRLRDLKAELLTEFEGIDRFPVNPDWRINAKFFPYQEPKEISIPTILGTVETELSPGKLEFNLNNKTYNLEPVGAGKRLFIVFADLTSGEETYGAGRFLYVDAPDSNNNVILDFNKAYNPPCAFTKYATCPLPPDQNKLRIRIDAGEKNYGKGD